MPHSPHVNAPSCALLALSMGLLGCASMGPPPEDCAPGGRLVEPTRSAVTLLPKGTLDTPKALLDSSLAGALDSALIEVGKRVPGVSATVILPGKGRWTGHTGLARTDPSRALQASDRFQIASIGKLYTSILAMQIVGEGRLHLQDPLSKWYPAFPGSDLITVEHLLRHTSGLATFNNPDLQPKVHRTPEDLISDASDDPLLFCPGTHWSYSNTGYVILGKILERVEGIPFDSILHRRIVTPLKLHRTVMRRHNDTLSEIVSGHLNGIPDSADYSKPFSAGSLASNSEEVAEVLAALLDGRLLPREVLGSMAEEMAPMQPNPSAWYGRGLMLYDTGTDGPGVMIGHSGGIVGFTSVVAYLPQDNAVVCVLFNDKRYAAEAGLWSLVQALRRHESP